MHNLEDDGYIELIQQKAQKNKSYLNCHLFEDEIIITPEHLRQNKEVLYRKHYPLADV